MSDNPHVQYANAKLRHKKQKSQGFHSDAKHAEREMIRISNLHKIKTGKHINDHAEALVAHHEKAKEIKRQYVQHSTDLIHAKKAGDKERMERAAKGKAQAEKDHLAHTGEPAEEKFVEYKRPMKESKEMKTFKEMMEACCSACEKRDEMEESDSGLAAKADKSGVSIGTLRKVYKRGVAAWNSGHRPGTTPQQWGMARVNSYITKGKGTYHGADKDLREAIQWTKPKNDEHDEVHTQLDAVKRGAEYPAHVHKMLKHLSNKSNFQGAMKNAKPMTITHKDTQPGGKHAEMSNTEATESKPKLGGLDQTKVRRVKKIFNNAMKHGKPMERPIVLHDTHTGHTHLLAGNTRLTHNTHYGSGSTVVHAIKYDSSKMHDKMHEEVEQTDEQAPVAPTLDRKYLKGTPEHKAYKASKVRQKYRLAYKNGKISVKEEIELEEVAKDKESGLPKKYVSGLSPSTAKARAAHWEKMDKLSDKDPAAYEPAPGDATAKTKESKHTIKARKMFGEACWTGYKRVGMKKKGDKIVPNCVPVKEATHVGIYPHGGGSDIHHDNEPDDEVTNHPTSNAVGNEPHKGNAYFRRPTIKKYVGQIRKSASKGNPMPPVIGTPHPENPEVKSVVDGNHRLRGQQNARRENIPVQNVPHHKIHLMPNSYDKTPESKDMGQKIKTHGVPLSSLRNKNGKYDMDKPRHQLGGKTIRHYFTNTDGTHNFGEPPKPANEEVEQVGEAVFQGKKVPLNKPMAGDVKKSKVYVDPDGDGTAQKVNFGDKNMTIKKHIPGRRKNFRARHNCDNPGPKTKARYWSCRAW